MVIKRSTRDVVPKLSTQGLEEHDMTSTRLDILHEIVERVMRENPQQAKAAAAFRN